MYESMQLSSKLQKAITNAVRTLKDGTNDFDEVALEFRIDKEDRIIISMGAKDGSTLERSLYSSIFETIDIAESTIDIVDFTGGEPHLIGGDYIIKDRQGKPKDWQITLLDSMRIVADLMAELKGDDNAPDFTLTCNTCGSNNCGVLTNQEGVFLGFTCMQGWC